MAVVSTSCRRGEGEDELGADDLLGGGLLALVAAAEVAAGEDFLLPVPPVPPPQLRDKHTGCEGQS